MLKKVLSISLTLALLTGFSCAKSCEKDPNANVDTKDSAALINGKSISVTKLDEMHQNSLTQMKKSGQAPSLDVERKIRGSILRRLIDDELVNQKAQNMNISVSESELSEAVEQYKARMGGQKGYDMMLKQSGMSQEQIAKNLSGEIIRKRILEKSDSKINISEEEILGFYEANKKLYELPEMVHARHILLKLNNTDGPEKVEELKQKAMNILEEAKKPGANFEELAQKYSEGPSQKTGGDLGFFGRGRMVKEFEDVVFNAPIKTPMGPVKTDFGFHVVFVDEKKAAHTASVEESRDRIIESLTRNKQARLGEDILDKLRKDAKIKILDYSITEKEYSDFYSEEKIAQADKE